MLFDNARHWLLKEGVEAMDGPINFGERDKWWGLVTEGFHAPLYGMNYNPPYYLKLFEDYGFQLFYEQFCFGMKLDRPLQEKIWERHRSVAQNPAFTVKNLKKNNISVDLRSQGIRISPHIYNDEADMSHLIEVIKTTKF